MEEHLLSCKHQEEKFKSIGNWKASCWKPSSKLPVLFGIFPMSTWWQVPRKGWKNPTWQGTGPCSRLNMQGIRNQVPFWNETSTVALPARFQTRQQGSAECFSKPLVWLQSCLCPGSRLVLRSFGSLFRANPFAFGDLEKQWWKCSRLSLMLLVLGAKCLWYCCRFFL